MSHEIDKPGPRGDRTILEFVLDIPFRKYPCCNQIARLVYCDGRERMHAEHEVNTVRSKVSFSPCSEDCAQRCIAEGPSAMIEIVPVKDIWSAAEYSVLSKCHLLDGPDATEPASLQEAYEPKPVFPIC